MHASEEIIVLFAKAGDGVYPDPDNDYMSYEMGGFFTWCSQEVVPASYMTIVFSFPVDDAMYDHSVTFIDRLVSWSCGNLSFEQARDISRKFNMDIRTSIAQHGNPHYVHSSSYSAGMLLSESIDPASDVESALRSGML